VADAFLKFIADTEVDELKKIIAKRKSFQEKLTKWEKVFTKGQQKYM
jgi:hypothetical protein